MIIRHSDGITAEGIILSRSDKAMLVAVKGREEPMLLTCVNGFWLSEESEPVVVEFEWQRRRRKPAISESDCVCPRDLAARLTSVLLSRDEDDACLERRLALLELHQMMENGDHTDIESVN